MQKKNKKGYIRTLEAVIAIVIIFGFIISVLPTGKKPEEAKRPPEIELTCDRILSELQSNSDYREKILTNEIKDIKDFIDIYNLVPITLNYALKICETETSPTCVYCDEKCCENGGDCPESDFLPNTEEITEAIYTKSIFISTTLDAPELKPKSITLYVWYKSI